LGTNPVKVSDQRPFHSLQTSFPDWQGEQVKRGTSHPISPTNVAGPEASHDTSRVLGEQAGYDAKRILSRTCRCCWSTQFPSSWWTAAERETREHDNEEHEGVDDDKGVENTRGERGEKDQGGQSRPCTQVQRSLTWVPSPIVGLL